MPWFYKRVSQPISRYQHISYLDVKESNARACVVEFESELLALLKIWAGHVRQIDDRDGVKVTLDDLLGDLEVAKTGL